MTESPSPASINATPGGNLQLALRLAHMGRRPEAIHVLRGLLDTTPDVVAARCLLAMLLQESGDGLAALKETKRAIELAPADATAHEIHASVLLALGRASEAEMAARSALAIDPRRARAHEYLGLAQDALERVEETIGTLRSALALQPDSALARQILARRLLQRKDVAAALEAALHPSLIADAEKGIAAAEDFIAVGALAEAIAVLLEIVSQHPGDYRALILLARSLHRSGRSSEALDWSGRAHALRPHEIEPLEMHAVSLIDRGDVDAGLARLRDLLHRPDAGAETSHRHLILAHYDPNPSDEALFQAHVDWVQRHVHSFGAPFVPQGDLDTDRPLRIGWLSPRFGEGPVASFFTETFAAFDRKQFRHVLVPLAHGSETATARLRGLADEWLPLHDRDDQSLLQELRDARLDIAIDLAGHAVGNRIGVIAQRIAPVQLCWLDYFDTTALPAMDGWISDPWLTPDDSSQRFTERVWRLTSGCFCYSPPPSAPEPGRIGGGPVVFVSCNRLAKLNDGVLDAWSEILRRVPGSQLELGARLLDDRVARERTIERFAARGIPMERLRLHATRNYQELLAGYRAADIALDPFPYTGCTTTCDALWMGLPVVSMAGTSIVSRQSASMLWRLGLDKWVARDATDYIERVVELADGIDAVRSGRHALRERTRLHLCDAAGQAAEFGKLLREVWCDHRTGKPRPISANANAE